MMTDDEPGRSCFNKKAFYDIPDLVALFINLILFLGSFILTPFNPLWVPPGDSLSSYPTHDSTVSNQELFIYGIGSALLVILLLYYGHRCLPSIFNQMNPFAALWLWGSQAVLVGLFTQVLKCYVGRPRPDLYVRCGPDAEYDTCPSLTGETLDNQFSSWPSGHASFSFGGFFFVALLLKRGINTDASWLSTVAVLLTGFAFWIGATRIGDFKHHPDDVLAGMFIGASVTSLIWYRGYRRIFAKSESDAESVLSDIL
jgi:phosphatidate phosphatase